MNINVLTLGRSGQSIMTVILNSWCPSRHVVIIGNTHPKDVRELEGTRIILIRDFRNWLASAIVARVNAYPKGGTVSWKSMIHHIGVYKSLLKEIKDREYWQADIVISYDKFFESEEYRRSICEQLGGIYTEEKFNFVPNTGGGSSFDKMNLQGAGSKMKVLSRHEQVLETDKADIYINMLEEYKDIYEEYKAFIKTV